MNKRQEKRHKKQDSRNKSTENKEQEAKHEKKVIKSYKDLEVYKLSYKLAMEIFWLTKKFPKDELYSLTTQMRNSSRSVPVHTDAASHRHWRRLGKEKV